MIIACCRISTDNCIQHLTWNVSGVTGKVKNLTVFSWNYMGLLIYSYSSFILPLTEAAIGPIINSLSLHGEWPAKHNKPCWTFWIQRKALTKKDTYKTCGIWLNNNKENLHLNVLTSTLLMWLGYHRTMDALGEDDYYKDCHPLTEV